MTFRTKFLLFVSICVPPNNPITACGVTSFPGYHSFPKWAITLFVFPLTKITQLCPQVFSVNGSITCSGLHFWCHFDVIGSIIFSELHFWRHWFNIWSTAVGCGKLCERFNQLETEKYFEWIIMYFIYFIALFTWKYTRRSPLSRFCRRKTVGQICYQKVQILLQLLVQVHTTTKPSLSPIYHMPSFGLI